MQLKVNEINFEAYKRVIAISDIHGDLEGFKNILKEVNFTSEDALVIVGDLLEKGQHSLELLRTVMNMTEKRNIFLVLGNNDVIFQEWQEDEVSDADICWYMNSRNNSILIEMAHELDLSYHDEEDIKKMKPVLFEKYKNEIDFLSSLPHIIDSPYGIFVHAGITSEDLLSQNVEYCLTAPTFALETYVFKKPVIVGHWPASNYCQEIIDVKMHVNSKTQVYSIDGGNSMKSWQQINYLILYPDHTMESGYVDTLPRIRILENQSASTNPLTLIYPYTKVNILERKDTKSLCFIPQLNKEMWIENHLLYPYKGNDYCEDFTTYYLPLQKDEVVSFCEEIKEGILVKKNGIVGIYSGQYESL